MFHWRSSGATSECTSISSSHAASFGTTASSLAASASAASHTSTSAHGSINHASLLLVWRWTSQVLRRTHWTRTSTAWSTFSGWTTTWPVSAVHTLGRTHRLVSHHWSSAWFEVAWVTSRISSGRVVLVEWLSSPSSFRIHTHAFAVVGSIGSWTIATISRSATIEIGVTVWGHWIVTWRIHEKVMPVAISVIVV